MRSGVKHRNISSNAKWGKPVVYLYYNQAGSFTNLNEVVSVIRE